MVCSTRENQQRSCRVFKMNSKLYKWCAVPLCKSTSIATPNKLFVYVPIEKIVRDKWLSLARRDPKVVVTHSLLYFCEDHFDLPNDMENFMEYHVMGSVSEVRMKSGCIPKKFACQPDRRKRTSNTTERPYIHKKRKIMAIEDCEKQLEESRMATEVHFEEIASGSSESQQTSEGSTSTELVVAAGKPVQSRSDLNLPKEPSLQKQGTKNGDMDQPNSTMRVCGICFATDGIMYLLSVYERMYEAYETLTGLSIKQPPTLPHFVCGECARRLLYCARFRARALRARDKLLENKRVSVKTIKRLQNECKETVIDNQLDRKIISTSLSFVENAKIHRATQTDIQHNMNVLGEDVNTTNVKMEFDDSIVEDMLNHTLADGFGCIPSSFDAVNAVKVEADDIINQTLPFSANETNYTSLNENVDKIATQWNDMSTTMSHSAKDTSNDAVEARYTLDLDIKIEEGLPVGNDGNNTLHNERVNKQTNYLMGSDSDHQPSWAEMSSGAEAAPRAAEEANKTTGTALRSRRVDDENKTHLSTDSFKTYPNEDNDMYCCDICRETDLTKRELNQHIRLAHSAEVTSGEGRYKQFKKKENLTTRNRKRSVQKAYLCEICCEMFSKRSSLKLHLNVHSGEKIFSCGICNDEFEKKENFTAHLKIHSGVTPFVCDICNKTFSTHSSLNAHIKIHSDKKPFACDICDKTFSAKGVLRAHVRIVHSGTKYSCEICKKEFKKKDNLKAHSKTHTGERPFSCEICSKTFTTRSTLNVHIRTHTGVKPYACDVCNKAFYRPDDLKQHTTIHSGDKPFACSVCELAFNKRNNLKMHMRIHSGEKPYSCDVCSKKFNRKDGVKKHLASHFGLKPYTCDHCDRTFHRKDCLISHLKVHFGKKLFSCDICNKTFGQKFYFQKHLRSHSDT